MSPAFDTATRLDAGSSRVAVSVDVCDSPVAVVAVPDGGGESIACSVERSLWHVDPAGDADRKIELEAVPTDVALDGDRVWVSLRQD